MSEVTCRRKRGVVKRRYRNSNTSVFDVTEKEFELKFALMGEMQSSRRISVRWLPTNFESPQSPCGR